MGISGIAQEKVLLAGQVRDMTNSIGVSGAHIINLNDTVATITDLQGIFRIPVQIGDSLKFTCIGFNDRMLILSDSILAKSPLYIGLAPKVYELDEITVNPFTNKSQFKNDFMNLHLASDGLDIPGIPKKEIREYPVWEDTEEMKKAVQRINAWFAKT